MDPVKVQAITNWPAPRNLRNLHGFLSFANFYRHFIKDFAKLTQPLNNLTRKDIPWHWGVIQQHTFQALKDMFSYKPILAMWEPNHSTHLEVDTSGYAMGSVLLQKLNDNLWHPIAY
jgi:hypothetical protein